MFALAIAAFGVHAVVAQVDDLATEVTAFTTVNVPNDQVSIAATGDAAVVGTVVAVTTSTLQQPETPTPTTPGTTATTSVRQGRVYVAELNGNNEVPANNSPATGSAVLVFTGSNTANLSMSFTGLTSPQTAAHIHGPGEIGVNAPAIIPLPNGQISNHSITFTDEQLAQIDIGMLYINIHTEQYPEGEIRGQLLWDMEASQRIVFGSPVSMVVNAWGINWQVETTADTAFISDLNTPVTTTTEDALPMAGDRVAVVGMVVTSTNQTPTLDTTTSTAPTINAFSVMKLPETPESTNVNETGPFGTDTTTDTMNTTSSEQTNDLFPNDESFDQNAQ